MGEEKNEVIYEARVADFYDNYEKYLIEEVIPDVLAYYLKTAYEKNLLSKCPIINHLNSAIDSFNLFVKVDNELINKVEKILVSKYNLKIENRNESKLVLIKK